MVTSYLRTNERKTGGKVDMGAIGPGILLASAAGGAGTTNPYGGLLVFSQTLSFGEGSAGIAAGFSYAFGDSTVGTLSLYYGSGNFGDGYVFFPVHIYTLSMSTITPADKNGGGSIPFFYPYAYATSGSIWRISALKVSTTGSCTNASAVPARLLIIGFIVSAP